MTAAVAKPNPARWAFPEAFIPSIVPVNLKKKIEITLHKKPALHKQPKRKYVLSGPVQTASEHHSKVTC